MEQKKSYGNGMSVFMLKIIENDIKKGNSFYLIDGKSNNIISK